MGLRHLICRVNAAGLGAVLTLGWGCGVPVESSSPQKALDLAAVDYRVPADAGSFAPAFTQLEGDPAAVDVLAEVERCAECHEDIVAQWRESPHARSSFDNPWYRATVERFRDDVGFRASRFCAACHDPLLLLSGRMDREVETTDPWASAGVTCGICHSAVETQVDGRGSYTVSTEPIPIPIRGDAESLARHRARVGGAVLREPALCGSCHRAFLDGTTGNSHFLPGMDDLGAWRSSTYGGSEAALLEPADPPELQDCGACHLPEVGAVRRGPFAREGRTRSHRMAGGQTALAAQAGPPQRAATEQMLGRAASIDVAVAEVIGSDGVSIHHYPADGAAVSPRDRVLLDVVLRNQGVGHRFPGGVRDTQDTWVELTVRDAAGRSIAEAGTSHETQSDSTAYRLFTGFVDDSAEIEERHLVHRFRTRAIERTIAPRDAALVRYEFTVPSHATGPLRVEARLRHRRHSLAFARFVCAEMGSTRDRVEPGPGRNALDGCAEQPVTDLATTTVFLGASRTGVGGAERASWLRLFEHGLAVSHDVQERVSRADRSLELAFTRAPTPRARAAVLALRSTIEARQGRLEEALRYASEAEALLGTSHSALDRARGRAYARVWRWPEAARAFRRTAQGAPGDVATHRDLAQALGSFASPRAALFSTALGLGLSPRESQLLRSQALALERLGHPVSDRAKAVSLAVRDPDARDALLLRCALRVPGCDQAQRPVPLIRMRSQ